MLEFTESSASTGATTVVSTVMIMMRRLTAALHLIQLAEEVVPKLVSDGRTPADHGARILGQIPALRADIDEQVNAAKALMESIQDRVESLTQFLMLHRNALSRAQSEDLDRWLAELRG